VHNKQVGGVIYDSRVVLVVVFRW